MNIAYFAALIAVATTQAVFAQPSPPQKPTGGIAINVPPNLESAVRVRDPFRRILAKKESGESLDLPEIERTALDKFRLVGVITGPKKQKALVVGPSGKIFILSERAKIGPRKGIIKRITPTSLRVEERVINLLGEEEKIETSIELAEGPAASTVSTSPTPKAQPQAPQNNSQPTQKEPRI